MMYIQIFLLSNGQGWPAFAEHLKRMTAHQPKIVIDNVELQLDPNSGEYFYQLGRFCRSWPTVVPAGALNLVKIIKPNNPGNMAKPGEYDYPADGWWASVENSAAHPGSGLQVVQNIIVTADFLDKATMVYGQVLRREVEPTSAWEPPEGGLTPDGKSEEGGLSPAKTRILRENLKRTLREYPVTALAAKVQAQTLLDIMNAPE